MTIPTRLALATAPLALIAAVPALAEAGPMAPEATAAATTTAATDAAPATPQALGPKERGNQTIASPVQEAYPADAVGDGNTAGGYNQSRWAEDWTRYRNPAKRDDPLDRLKFIPFDANGNIYLTLSGELRFRVNQTTNPNLRDAEAQRQDITRIVGGADLHLGNHVRVFGELAHAGLAGRNLGTITPQMRNDLVVQQSFVDVTGKVAEADVGVRYGRQTFADGPNLMVVPRDNNTIFFVYNGTRAWARAKSVRVDLFDFRTTRLGVGGTSDDISERGRRFSGISGGIVLPKTLFGGSKLYLDPFFWRLRNDNATWGRTTTREERFFYGLHTLGDIGPVNLDWTVNYQGGNYNGRSIDAWLVLLAQNYRIGKSKSAPRIGFHFDYATGGGAFGTGKLRNALAPFGNNIYYSYQLYATPTNLIAFAPSFTFAPMSKLRVSAEYQLSWRETLGDAVYRANGTAFAGTQLVGGRKIADTARLQAVYTVSPRVSLTGRYEHLMVGPALSNAGYKSSDFLAGWLSLRF